MFQQLLGLNSSSVDLLGGIDKVCCISQSNQQQCRYDQSSGGELEGAKALLLTLVTKVDRNAISFTNKLYFTFRGTRTVMMLRR